MRPHQTRIMISILCGSSPSKSHCSRARSPVRVHALPMLCAMPALSVGTRNSRFAVRRFRSGSGGGGGGSGGGGCGRDSPWGDVSSTSAVLEAWMAVMRTAQTRRGRRLVHSRGLGAVAVALIAVLAGHAASPALAPRRLTRTAGLFARRTTPMVPPRCIGRLERGKAAFHSRRRPPWWSYRPAIASRRRHGRRARRRSTAPRASPRFPRRPVRSVSFNRPRRLARGPRRCVPRVPAPASRPPSPHHPGIMDIIAAIKLDHTCLFSLWFFSRFFRIWSLL